MSRRGFIALSVLVDAVLVNAGFVLAFLLRFEGTLPAFNFRAYLDSITSYEQNHYEFDPAMVDRIGREWAFAIERWGYRRLPVGSRPLG